MALFRVCVLAVLLAPSAYAQTAAPSPSPVPGATPSPAAAARAAMRHPPEPDPAAPQPIAARCRIRSTPYQDVMAGQTRSITVSNDGGWCRSSALVKDMGPYQEITVDEPPQHGTVEIHNLKTMQAIYYKATPGYVGPDTAVLIAKPYFGRITMNITVKAPAARTAAKPGPT